MLGCVCACILEHATLPKCVKGEEKDSEREGVGGPPPSKKESRLGESERESEHCGPRTSAIHIQCNP